MPSNNVPNAVELTKHLQEMCWIRADQILNEGGEDVSGVDVRGPQENRRKSALARLRACEEMIASLRQAADFELTLAVGAEATLAEVGAACDISRQAARKRYLRITAEQQRRQKERLQRRNGTDLEWEPEDDRWPPRPWRFRAPMGLRTVRLVDGPADTKTIRIAVGEDAFQVVGDRVVFGQRFTCYARYTADGAESNRYRFTGEYYLR